MGVIKRGNVFYLPARGGHKAMRIILVPTPKVMIRERETFRGKPFIPSRKDLEAPKLSEKSQYMKEIQEIVDGMRRRNKNGT